MMIRSLKKWKVQAKARAKSTPLSQGSSGEQCYSRKSKKGRWAYGWRLNSNSEYENGIVQEDQTKGVGDKKRQWNPTLTL